MTDLYTYVYKVIDIISDRSDQIIKQSVSQKLQNKTIFESCSSVAPDGKPRHTVHAAKIPAAWQNKY